MRFRNFLTSNITRHLKNWICKYHELALFVYYGLIGPSQGDIVRYINQRPKVFNLLGKVSENECVLDVACGSGLYTGHLSRKTVNLVAIDADKKQINVLRNAWKISNVNLILADAQYLPLRGGTFDKALCIEVLEHLSDDNLGIRELSRVLVEGKMLVISSPNTSVHNFYKTTINTRVDDKDPFAHKRVGYNINELFNKLRKNGIEIIDQDACLYYFSQRAEVHLVGRRLPAIFVSTMYFRQNHGSF